MVVSWNEKPTLSPARMMRLLRHWPSSETTSRSVPVISSVVRTIMGVESPSSASECGTGGAGDRSGTDLGGRFRQDVQPELEFVVGDGQRRQQLDDLVRRTGGLGEQTLFEGQGADLVGVLRLVEDQALDQAATAGRDAVEHVRQVHEGLADALPRAQGVALEFVVGPVVLEGGSRRHEGRVVAAEGAVVLARAPHVELTLEQGERQRHSVSADRL